ncbi:hypothetical protein [Desulfonema magnum]|uniref:Uncharacterized protein n=1 Tax=Desulfonema magnum TaxID=45655 RepID=A0A975BXV6_9BACT|nr:hypothetical protein [Desulfonema magnum]QTA93175.1 Uncharacterized protein dnm_092720 [Desulfonema magnum]
MNIAVNDMDKVSQQNAANAEESASVSKELKEQAEQMKSLVKKLTVIIGGKRISGRGQLLQESQGNPRIRHLFPDD